MLYFFQKKELKNSLFAFNLSFFFWNKKRIKIKNKRKLSNEFKIPVIRDTRLVRGLDYYNGTAFEIKCTDPIVQNILG